MITLIVTMFIWFAVLAFTENKWKPLIIFLAIWALFSFIGSLS